MRYKWRYLKRRDWWWSNSPFQISGMVINRLAWNADLLTFQQKSLSLCPCGPWPPYRSICRSRGLWLAWPPLQNPCRILRLQPAGLPLRSWKLLPLKDDFITWFLCVQSLSWGSGWTSWVQDGPGYSYGFSGSHNGMCLEARLLYARCIQEWSDACCLLTSLPWYYAIALLLLFFERDPGVEAFCF